jgi:hypothetical protein
MSWLYRIFSGGTIFRPLLWLLAIDAVAYFAYARFARPDGTAAGRVASGAWTWTKSLFVKARTPAAPATELSAEQHRALFEFWWAGAMPLGTVTDAAYQRAIAALFGAGGMPWYLHLLQSAQIALTVIFVLLIALALRDRVAAARARAALGRRYGAEDDGMQKDDMPAHNRSHPD